MGAIFALIDYCVSGTSASLWVGAGLLAMALFMDIADGHVARMRGEASGLGRELDSLADVVSFGVAPAVVGYAFGFRGGWDLVCLTFFVTCGISRLARFNVTATKLSDASGKVRYFEGLPIPTSLLLAGLFFALTFTGHSGDDAPLGVLELGPAKLHPLALLYVAHGAAMISKTLRIPKP